MDRPTCFSAWCGMPGRLPLPSVPISVPYAFADKAAGAIHRAVDQGLGFQIQKKLID
jgi:hypothetical protein